MKNIMLVSLSPLTVRGILVATISRYFPLLLINFVFIYTRQKTIRPRARIKKAFLSITKSIDPGLSALYAMAVDQIRNIRQNIVQKEMIDQQATFTSMQSQTTSLIPIINHALGNTLPLDLSSAMISLMKKLRVRESISLQNSNLISGFLAWPQVGYL